MNQPSRLAYWLALQRVAGLGVRAKLALARRFGEAQEIFSASRKQLEQVLADELAQDNRKRGWTNAITGIARGPDIAGVESDLPWFDQPDHHLITWSDADYPPLLREIADPPIVLYVLGKRALLKRWQIAIVGSRNPTPMGRENAHAFAHELARAGFVITSGLALGVDGAAHRGALKAGGFTIAIAGNGLNRVYPPQHRELAHEIAARGAVVSEFPLDTSPRPENFPIRNRIISGLSLGTLVVEAAARSGSLITARLANEQGREVFALPGSIHSPQARGCHALIRQGAKLVETAQDIVEELGALTQVAPQATMAPDSADADLEPKQNELLAHLGYDPTSVDTLVKRSGLTANTVSSMLLELELRGFVAVCAGGKYQRTALSGAKANDERKRV